jgi:hypothetical protein
MCNEAGPVEEGAIGRKSVPDPRLRTPSCVTRVTATLQASFLGSGGRRCSVLSCRNKIQFACRSVQLNSVP